MFVESGIVQRYNFSFLLRTVHRIISTMYITFDRSETDNTFHATVHIKLCKKPLNSVQSFNITIQTQSYTSTDLDCRITNMVMKINTECMNEQ